MDQMVGFQSSGGSNGQFRQTLVSSLFGLDQR